MGLFGGIGRRLRDGRLNDAFASTQAILGGDYAAAAQIGHRRRQAAAEAAQAKAEAEAERQVIEDQRMAAANMTGPNGAPAFSKAEIMAMSPTDISAAARARVDPYSLSPDQERHTSTGNGGMLIYRSAPSDYTQRPGEVRRDGATNGIISASPYPEYIPGTEGAFQAQAPVSVRPVPFQGNRSLPPPPAGGLIGSSGRALGDFVRGQMPGQTPPIAAPVDPTAPPGTASPQSPESPQATSASRWDIISVPGDPRDGGRRRHAGYDMRNPERPEWVAPMNYEVRNVRNGRRSGITADVHFEDGTVVTAMHFREPPREGRGTAGSIIGYQGNTGNARTTPAHLHAEARDAQGRRINPSSYFGLGARNGPPRINNPAELAALPSGAIFIAPDGTPRRKP